MFPAGTSEGLIWAGETYLDVMLAVFLGEGARKVDDGVVMVLEETKLRAGSSQCATGLCVVSSHVAAMSPAASVVAPARSVKSVGRF